MRRAMGVWSSVLAAGLVFTGCGSSDSGGGDTTAGAGGSGEGGSGGSGTAGGNGGGATAGSAGTSAGEGGSGGGAGAVGAGGDGAGGSAGGVGGGANGGSGDGAVTLVSVGSKTTGSTSDKWATITVDVPDGVESFMLTAASSDLKATLGAGKLVAPDGTTLYDGTASGAQPYTVVDSSPGLPFAALFPNTPSLKLQKGAYQFSLASATGDATVQVGVLLKKGDGTTKPAALPVTFWFTKTSFPAGAPLTKDSAKTDAKFQQALGVFKTIYKNAQITVDDASIAYRDVAEVLGDSKAASYAVIPSEDDLAKLYSDMNAFATAPGLHVYFIDQYTFMGGDGTLGIAGGIPGPSAFDGVPHAGVSCGVAALYAAGGGGLDPADDFGATIAHEGGHYLGLYHTTEKEGASYDPIPDTPECSAVDATMVHSPDVCAGMGNDNFMFWQSADKLQSVVSPGQAYVLQMNPSVKQ